MPRTRLMLIMLPVLAGTFTALFLIAAGRGWLLGLGLLVWLAVVYVEYRARELIAVYATEFLPPMSDSTRRFVGALLLVAMNMLILLFVALARTA